MQKLHILWYIHNVAQVPTNFWLTDFNVNSPQKFCIFQSFVITLKKKNLIFLVSYELWHFVIYKNKNKSRSATLAPTWPFSGPLIDNQYTIAICKETHPHFESKNYSPHFLFCTHFQWFYPHFGWIKKKITICKQFEKKFIDLFHSMSIQITMNNFTTKEPIPCSLLITLKVQVVSRQNLVSPHTATF